MQIMNLWRRYKYWISSPVFSILLGIILFVLNNSNLSISLGIIILSLLVPFVIISVKEIKIKRNQISNIWGTEMELDVVIRIVNENGDASIHSRFKITNKDKQPVKFISRDIYSTAGNEISLSKPRVIDSTIPDIEIIERSKYEYEKVVFLNNKQEKHKFIECDYKLEPPLIKNNDYLIYEIDIDAKGYSKDVSKSSSVDGYIVKSASKMTKITVISPDKYKLELLDYWVEDNQANRIEYLKSIILPPSIENNDSQLKWDIKYPKINHLYLFRYCIKSRL